MKAFGGFLLTLLVIVVIVGVVGVISYTHEMAPTWAEIAKQQADLDIAIAKQNAQSDIAQHSAVSMAISAGSWVLVLLLLAGGVVWFVWKPMDERKESWARPVDGQHAIQTFSNGRITWKVDIDKSFPGNAGFDHSTGMLGDLSSGAQESNQLTYNLAVQKTRTVTAASSQPIKYAAHAKMLAGGYDREPRHVAQTPAHDDGEAMPVDFQPLTVQDALAQSTPDSWVLGQNQETGELFTLNIREVVHLGIVGATGTGKTMYVALLMMINAIRSKWRVIILDGKGGADWSKFGQYVEYYALDYTNVGAMLKQITDEYNQRQAKLNAAQANSVWELTPTPRPTMVMVDEFGAVMDSLKVASPAEHKKVSLDLGNLLRLSRSAGISMVFCDQDPSKWPSAMRANLPVNICFRLGGMKGNSVSEFNLHELDRVAHFQVNGERFHALPTYRVIDAMLPSIEYKKPKALLYPPVDVRSVRSEDVGGEDSNSIPPVANERTTEQTDRQRALKEWRAANPGEERGMQTRAIRELQAQGIDISKSYVCEMWDSCASPMAWQEEGEDDV